MLCRVMASPWSLRLHLEGINSLNDGERGDVYEALKGYDRADRRELCKIDAATLKDLGVLDQILRQAILASVGSTGDVPPCHPRLVRVLNTMATKPAAG